MMFKSSLIALAGLVTAAAPFAASAQYYGYGDRYAPPPAYYNGGYGYDRVRYDRWRAREAQRRYWRHEQRERARWDRGYDGGYGDPRYGYRPY